MSFILRRPPAQEGGGALFDWGGVQYTTLEMTQPRNDLPTGHRMLKAYTGLLYEVRVACSGGVYPYLYEITSGAGSGMTINADTGVISWPNPQSNCTPTVRVTDTKGSTTSETWTITVGTSGFKFVDAVSGTTNWSGGTGTLANPWRTFEDQFENGSATDIVYFRGGSYDMTGVTKDGPYSEGYFVDVIGTAPRIWIAYPGEAADINLGGNTNASNAIFAFDGSEYIWMEGIEFHNSYHKMFNMGGGSNGGGTFWRCDFHDHTSEVSNTSVMMWNHAGPPRTYGIVIQDNAFHNEDELAGTGGGLPTLLYDCTRVLIEGNTYTDFGTTFSPKAGTDKFTFRGNTIVNCHYALSSNFDDYSDGTDANGELCFNLYLGPWDFDDPSVDIGCLEFGPTWPGDGVGQIAVYRNTINGPISCAQFADTDGPIIFFRNVIVNSYNATTPITHMREVPGFSAPDWDAVQDTENIKGVTADAIIDAVGLLQGSYRTTYLYLRGHEVP